jgi:DNA-directed RNA polymerase subunit H
LVASPFRLVVKHEILSESEVKKVSKKFKTPAEKLPRIQETDPQALKIGAKPGQVIVIHRKDPTGEYLYYRYVTKEM